MQSSSSPFVVNIVPLANVQTTSSGEDATATLSNSVAALQTIVNPGQRRIYTDFISAYTTGNTIQVLDPMNMSNVAFTQNGIPISGGGSVSSLGTTSTSLILQDTTSISSAAISMGVGQRPVFQILGDGNGLVYDASSIATEFRVSSMAFVADFGQFSTIQVGKDGQFGGVVYAQNFITLSDERRKRGVEPFSTDGVVSSMNGVRPYVYTISSEDPINTEYEIGLLAQELEGVFPECVVQKGGTKYVKYNAVVALLLGAVRELSQRVDALERGV